MKSSIGHSSRKQKTIHLCKKKNSAYNTEKCTSVVFWDVLKFEAAVLLFFKRP
jgi:hypothetical protein